MTDTQQSPAGRAELAVKLRDIVRYGGLSYESDHVLLKAATALDAMPQLVDALESLVKQFDRNGVRFLPDHACAECVPESEMLVAGFLCGNHAARAALRKAVGG